VSVREREIPDPVWIAFTVLVVVGIVLGFVCGLGKLSGAGLLVFFFGALAGFIPWACWKLDPDLMRRESAYREHDQGE
jgi:uncharacterized membrane protein